MNYLVACTSGEPDQYARAAVRGIASVLADCLPSFTSFMMEYPCHALHEERWFLMTVKGLRQPYDGLAMVTHANVTYRHDAESQTLPQRRRFASLKETDGTDAFTTLYPVDVEAFRQALDDTAR